jgi:hypothetical protein
MPTSYGTFDRQQHKPDRGDQLRQSSPSSTKARDFARDSSQGQESHDGRPHATGAVSELAKIGEQVMGNLVEDPETHRALSASQLASEMNRGLISNEGVKIFKKAQDIGYKQFSLYKRGASLAPVHNEYLQRDSADFLKACNAYRKARNIEFPISENIIESLYSIKDSKSNINVLPGLASIAYEFMRINATEIGLKDWPQQATYPNSFFEVRSTDNPFLLDAHIQIEQATKELQPNTCLIQ